MNSPEKWKTKKNIEQQEVNGIHPPTLTGITLTAQGV
jgi:hypothetical protein